jgi:hypothetical protein
MRIRLEYNEKQGLFNYESMTNPISEPNTFGWITVAKNIDIDIACWFCGLLDNWEARQKKKRKLTLQEVKKCWNAVTQSKSEEELLKLAKGYETK